jgi:hypothetical protein
VVDEYRLYVYPVAVGGGTPLFGDTGHPRGLRLVSSRAFQCGVLALVYRPASQQELDAIGSVPDTGKEAQAKVDAARADQRD